MTAIAIKNYDEFIKNPEQYELVRSRGILNRLMNVYEYKLKEPPKIGR